MGMSRERSADRLWLLNRWREIETPAMWFILFNFLDATLTYILLTHPVDEHGPWAVESNQFAKFFLDRWGLTGMFAFKLASVVVVCAIAFFIAHRNSTTARRLLYAGTLIIVTVAAYSAWLARGYLQL